MIESVYITLIILAFIMLPLSFFVGRNDNSDDTPKFGQQMVLLGVSTILFGALAAASANVEIVSCTSTACTKESFFFDDNMYIFGFFCLIGGVLTLVKCFDAFFFTKGKL